MKTALIFSCALMCFITGCDDDIVDASCSEMGNHYIYDPGIAGTVHEVCPHSGYNLLLSAILQEREEDACKYIDMGSDLEHCDSLGRNAICLAAQNGQLKVVTKLIEKGANINCRTYMTGYTPLHEAAANGHMEIVSLLLQSGARAQPKCNDEYDEARDGDMTPAQAAEKAGHIDVANCIQKWINEHP